MKCKKCTLFIPYWKNKESFKIEQLREDIDDYFRCVDYVLDMNIVGGEPFLYNKLGGGGLKFCKVCGGYGNDNKNEIDAAEQLMEDDNGKKAN